MDKKEKIKLLEEIMELEEGTLNEDSVLAEYDEWDSLTVISYMSLMDSKFHKNVSIEQIRKFETVSDAVDVM